MIFQRWIMKMKGKERNVVNDIFILGKGEDSEEGRG